MEAAAQNWLLVVLYLLQVRDNISRNNCTVRDNKNMLKLAAGRGLPAADVLLHDIIIFY